MMADGDLQSGRDRLARLEKEFEELSATPAAGADPMEYERRRQRMREIRNEIEEVEREVADRATPMDLIEEAAADASAVNASGTVEPDPSAQNGIDQEIARKQDEVAAQEAFAEANAGHAVELEHSEQQLADLEETKALAGCSPAVAGVILVVIAVTIGAILATSGGKDDDGDVAAGGPSTAVTGADDQPGADTSAPEADGELAAFAGTWNLASGLDDLKGLDVPMFTVGPAMTITLKPSDATIVIAEDGAISSASYATGFSSVSSTSQPPCNAFEATMSAESGTGFVAANGVGSVTFAATGNQTNPCGAPYEGDFGIVRGLAISGDLMVLCYGNAATATTCAAPAPDPAATLTRATPG